MTDTKLSNRKISEDNDSNLNTNKDPKVNESNPNLNKVSQVNESQKMNNSNPFGKINEDSIDFCCCLTLAKPSFYLFLNVLDLVYATMITLLTIMFNVEDTTSTVIDYLKVSLGTLNILLFGLAIVAFIFYLMYVKYNTAVHKIYSIVRIVVCGIR